VSYKYSSSRSESHSRNLHYPRRRSANS
jgi:hypothetical protein